MINWLSLYSLFADAVEGSKLFFNSAFVTALVGSLAGAFGGAWAAQRIAERAKQRDEILREIRNTNAAMALAISITNTFLGMKKQHVKRLYEEFQATKSRVEKAIQENKGCSPPAVVHFRADLETLPPIVTPIKQLQDAIADKVSLEPGPSMLLHILSNSISAFNNSIETRNELIKQWKGKLSEPELVPLYFGFPNKGHVDQTYPSVIDAIHTYTNDAIAFSKMLGELLNQHGKRQQMEFAKRFKGPIPKVSSFDLSQAKDMLPAEEDYADWQWVFEKKQTPPARWYVRIYEKFKARRAG